MEYPDWHVLAALLRWCSFMLILFVIFAMLGWGLVMVEKLLSEKVKKVWPHDAIMRFNTFMCWVIIGMGAIVLILAIVDAIIRKWYE